MVWIILLLTHALTSPLSLPSALGAALLSASMALATCGVEMLDLPIASSVVSIIKLYMTLFVRITHNTLPSDVRCKFSVS